MAFHAGIVSGQREIGNQSKIVANEVTRLLSPPRLRPDQLKREHMLRDWTQSRARLGLHAGGEVGPGTPVLRNERALE